MEAVGKLKIENRELKINKETRTLSTEITTRSNFQLKELTVLSTLLPYACGYTELTPAYLDF